MNCFVNCRFILLLWRGCTRRMASLLAFDYEFSSLFIRRRALGHAHSLSSSTARAIHFAKRSPSFSMHFRSRAGNSAHKPLALYSELIAFTHRDARAAHCARVSSQGTTVGFVLRIFPRNQATAVSWSKRSPMSGACSAALAPQYKRNPAVATASA